MKIILLILLINISTLAIQEDFNSLDSWNPLSFKKVERQSKYTTEMGILKSKSNNSASGIIYKDTFNPYTTSSVKWRWRVDNIYKSGDARSKSGDDFPLRVYIIFRSNKKSLKESLAKSIYGEALPHSALSYVWDSKNNIGEVIRNPYTSSARQIIIESGSKNLKRWIVEERNILEDYRLAFGEDPPNKASIAIMNDSDNTGESSISYMDYIYIK